MTRRFGVQHTCDVCGERDEWGETNPEVAFVTLEVFSAFNHATFGTGDTLDFCPRCAVTTNVWAARGIAERKRLLALEEKRVRSES